MRLPLRSLSFRATTQSGRASWESGCSPSSPGLKSPRITMSLPLWLRVSSEYPSSNLFALIDDAGRKGCMYGGPENGAAGLPSGPAMIVCKRSNEGGASGGSDESVVVRSLGGGEAIYALGHVRRSMQGVRPLCCLGAPRVTACASLGSGALLSLSL